MSEENQPKFPWLLPVGGLIAIIGIVVSIYSTIHHLEVKANVGGTDFSCNINDSLNCDDIARSEYSEVFGTPLGVWGAGFFLACLVLLWVATMNKEEEQYVAHGTGYVGLVVLGVIVSVVLAAISAAIVGVGCPTCMVIYGLCVLQAVALGIGRQQISFSINQKTISHSAMTAALTVGATVAAYSLFGQEYLGPGFHAGQIPTAEELLEEQLKELNIAAVTDIEITKSAYAGLGEDYRKGNDDAKIVLVEWADFQCPGCAALSRTLAEIAAEFKNEILIVFRNYPLDKSCNSSMQGQLHEHACQIAQVARCAGQYGKFWQYHDIAFAMQRQVDKESAKSWGKMVGLTEDQIKICLDSEDILNKIRDDINHANKVGVTATPTLFINGKLMEKRGADDIRARITAELQRIGI